MKTSILIVMCLYLLLPGGKAQPALQSIQQVENNLIPYVPVKGFKGWNIIDRMKYYKVPGVSIAVIKDFKIAWAKGYGLADTIKKIPVTTETMFSAGSISKFVSAVAAFRLIENGKLSLDSPVNNYLSSWKLAENDFTKKTPITLRMLLSHTAGTSQSSYFGFAPDKNPLPTVVDILNGEKVAESRPVVVNSEPKKEFRYSGGGSMMVQLAMMDVSRQDFAGLIQRIIFNKVGMKNSTFLQPLPQRYQAQAAWAYSAAPWFKGMPYVYPQQAAAGLYTTPTDLARLIIEIQKSYVGKASFLKADLLKEMFRPAAVVSNGAYKEEVAPGVFLLELSGNESSRGKYFEHQGVNAGFVAYAMGSIEDGNGVVIMMNTGDDFNGLGTEIRRSVAKIYNWYKFLPEEITPVILDTNTLNTFVGRYRRSSDEVIYLRREHDYLIENVNEGGDIYCFPVSKDTIVFTDYNIRAGFGKDENGRVISLQSVWQDKPMSKMKADEFTPSEYLKAKKYQEAKIGFRQMNMNEYQITYLIYNLLNKKPADPEAIHTLLELALDQHPNSAIVQYRWGDYYLLMKDKPNAIKSYQKALEFDPTDEQAREALKSLGK